MASSRGIRAAAVTGAIDGIAAKDDPLRGTKLAAFGAALVLGWVFILWSNKFHVTAPVVIVCLGYLCVVALVLNLWRTGAAAVASDDALDGDAWGRPIGAIGELEKEKKTLLKAIKEAEFDLAMGKLSKRDADSLINQYRSRAIDVIKELDRSGGDVKLSVRDQIDREVNARRELALQNKPSKRVKNAVAAKAAEAEAAKPAGPAEPKPDAKPAEPKADAKPADAKPEHVELVLVTATDIERLEALLATRDEVTGVERIDGGVRAALVGNAGQTHVVALLAACEAAGISLRTIAIRTEAMRTADEAAATGEAP
jgi:hypothetical protein